MAKTPKAAQLRGVPDYSVQVLHTCGTDPEPFVFWGLNDLGCTFGMVCKKSGRVSYAPEMIERMRLKSVRVVTQITAPLPATLYRLKLIYEGRDGEHYGIASEALEASEVAAFVFDIPMDKVDPVGWFNCALHFELLSPIDGAEAELYAIPGEEKTMRPIVIKGSHLEIKGA